VSASLLGVLDSVGIDKVNSGVPASASAVARGGFLIVLLGGPRGILAQEGPSVSVAGALGSGIRSLGLALLLLRAVARSARFRIVRQLDHS